MSSRAVASTPDHERALTLGFLSLTVRITRAIECSCIMYFNPFFFECVC